MENNKLITENEQTGLDAMAGDGGYKETGLGSVIRARMKRDNKRFWAGDNISEYIKPAEKRSLIAEATEAFEKVLDALLIDHENDPTACGWCRLYWDYRCQQTYWVI